MKDYGYQYLELLNSSENLTSDEKLILMAEMYNRSMDIIYTMLQKDLSDTLKMAAINSKDMNYED